jgi:hypothetical protein
MNRQSSKGARVNFLASAINFTSGDFDGLQAEVIITGNAAGAFGLSMIGPEGSNVMLR